jgi:hypothetical protein
MRNNTRDADADSSDSDSSFYGSVDNSDVDESVEDAPVEAVVEGPFSMDQMVGVMARTGYRLLRKHYNRTNDMASIALVLNPHHNLMYCRKNEWGPPLIEALTTKMIERFSTYTKEQTRNLNNVDFEDSDNDNVHEESVIIPTSRTQGDQSQPPDPAELTQYMSMRRTSAQKSPLETWIQLRDSFPTVHRMAMDFLSIPGTSAHVERVFSVAGIICSPRRSRLMPKTLQHQLSLREWIKFFNQESV